MNKIKWPLLGVVSIVVIIIIITIHFYYKNNCQCKLCGTWNLINNNIYIDGKLSKDFNNSKHIKLIFDKKSVISTININIENSKEFYYKIANNRIYYSIAKINNIAECDYYEYKIINKYLYIYDYKSKSIRKEEYIFQR